MACARHHTIHYDGFCRRLYFLLNCGIRRVAEQTGRKIAAIEIHPTLVLDLGDMARPYQDFPGLIIED